MAFTMESIEVSPTQKGYTGPQEFDLPVKEFTGYDRTQVKPKVSVEGEAQNPKQEITDAGAEVTPPQQEESVTLSSKMTAIARAEMADRRRKQDLDRREKELSDKLAKADKFDQLQAKLTAKDYSAADELGMNYDEYTQYLVDKQAQSDPEKERYRKIEERLSASEKALEEKEIREYETNQSLWKQEIAKLISDNEDFSSIKALGLEAVVLQHVNDSFEEDGIELTAEQAAKEIEEELVKRAEKFSSIPKLKKKSDEAPAQRLGPPRSAPKTITQNMTVTSQKQTSKPFHLMSESEQFAEAKRRVEAEKLARYGR